MNLLVKHYSGSISYGTNLPTSDTDFRGIYCDPPREVVTPWTPPRSEQWKDPTEEDTVLTELHKYMIGYVNGSPNVLETLWVDDRFITETSEAYEYLRSRRSELISKKLRYTYGGYALGQLKRMKGHYKWINNPQPEEPPVRSNYFSLVFNYTSDKIFNRDFNIHQYNEDHSFVPCGGNIFGIIENPGHSLFNDDGSIHRVDYSQIDDNIKKSFPKFIVKLNEDVYLADKDNHSNYWKWKRERNEKRSELEAKFGLDVKHLMHLVRLMRMCEEVLTDGEIKVFRPDAEELLAIRNGSWTYDDAIKWSKDQDAKLNTLMKKSDLPESVDLSKASEILIKTEEIANGVVQR